MRLFILGLFSSLLVAALNIYCMVTINSMVADPTVPIPDPVTSPIARLFQLSMILLAAFILVTAFGVKRMQKRGLL